MADSILEDHKRKQRTNDRPAAFNILANTI